MFEEAISAAPVLVKAPIRLLEELLEELDHRSRCMAARPQRQGGGRGGGVGGGGGGEGKRGEGGGQKEGEVGGKGEG